jgi:hypothetical protein
MGKSVVTLVLMLTLAAVGDVAEARPCSDRVPVRAQGVYWSVYTGDSARERRDVPCATARRIARRMLLENEGTRGWRCNARLQRCVRGGTYVDEFGNRQWRYLVGWHRQD